MYHTATIIVKHLTDTEQKYIRETFTLKDDEKDKNIKVLANISNETNKAISKVRIKPYKDGNGYNAEVKVNWAYSAELNGWETGSSTEHFGKIADTLLECFKYIFGEELPLSRWRITRQDFCIAIDMDKQTVEEYIRILKQGVLPCDWRDKTPNGKSLEFVEGSLCIEYCGDGKYPIVSINFYDKIDQMMKHWKPWWDITVEDIQRDYQYIRFEVQVDDIKKLRGMDNVIDDWMKVMDEHYKISLLDEKLIMLDDGMGLYLIRKYLNEVMPLSAGYRKFDETISLISESQEDEDMKKAMVQTVKYLHKKQDGTNMHKYKDLEQRQKVFDAFNRCGINPITLSDDYESDYLEPVSSIIPNEPNNPHQFTSGIVHSGLYYPLWRTPTQAEYEASQQYLRQKRSEIIEAQGIDIFENQPEDIKNPVQDKARTGIIS